MEIELYGSLFGPAPWKFPLDLSNKDAIESNSHYIKFISRNKESIKCPTAMRTPGKPCKESKKLHKWTTLETRTSPDRIIRVTRGKNRFFHMILWAQPITKNGQTQSSLRRVENHAEEMLKYE